MTALDLPDGLPAEFIGRDYDLTSRHILIARALRVLLPDGGTVLDIGGSDGLTASLLTSHRVVAVDLRSAGVDVVASGHRLPFRTGSFSAVAMLDVLEHVPDAVRYGMIDEATRVADIIVIAGPFRSPAVEAAEAHQRAIFEAMFDAPHPWLSEHLAAGLPSLPDLLAQLEGAGFGHAHFGSNPLALWSRLLVNTHVALRLGLDVSALALRAALLQEFMDAADATPPSYREIILAARQRSDLVAVTAEISPGADEALVSEWVERTDVNTGRLIDGAMRLLDTTRGELAEGWQQSVEEVTVQRSSLDSAVGQWQASVARIRELEAELAAATERYEGALDVAKRGWADSADRVVAITADFAKAQARAAATIEEHSRALTRASNLAEVLEDLWAAHPELWRDPVAGPPLTTTPRVDAGPNPGSRYHQWLEHRPATTSAPPDGPRFSVIVPVYNPDARFLEEAIRSVRAQTYQDWELVLYDVSSAPHVAPICKRFSALDDRIRHVSGENGGIAVNTNSGAAEATGDWFVLLDHDDELEAHALESIAELVRADSTVDFVYSDEDKIDSAGMPIDPFFKPDWSPDLLRTVNYITHLAAVRSDLWNAVGGMRDGFDGAQDYEFFLRVTGAAQRIAHVADVLYHWRMHSGSTAGDVRQKPLAHRAGRRALQVHLDVAEPGASVELGPGPTSHRVRYPVRSEKISVIMPFRDGSVLTNQALEGIAKHRGDLPFEVLLVSNQSVEDVTFRSTKEWTERWSWVKAVEYNEPFNFQKLNNWAVAHVDGPLLLFLNNDAEPLHRGWMEALAEHAQRPAVGAVGGRLFYPDGLVQHAGVAVGIGGFAEHPWAGMHPDAWTPAGPSYWTRNFLAVTAACLMIERSKFDEVGGFDERFTIGGGDVDLGLRLYAAGYRNVMTPYARLVHHESVTRGNVVPENDLTESLRSYAKYLNEGDPYYNRNLTLEDTSCRVALRPQRRVPTIGREDV